MANLFLSRANPSSQIGTDTVKLFSCDASLTIGSVVYPSTISNNVIVESINNTTSTPSIGIVVSKPTIVTCKVQLYGSVNINFVGLQRGRRVYLAANGSLTTAIPTTGYIQKLGMCYENNRVFLDPDEIRIKLAGS